MGDGNVVVLLSDDDDDDLFVPLNAPPPAATDSRQSATSPTRLSAAAVRNALTPLAAASKRPRRTSTHFGFLDNLSSDDLSSPFPAIRRGPPPNPLATNTQVHVNNNSRNAVIVLDDGEDEEDVLPQRTGPKAGTLDAGTEANPCKRPRLTANQHAASFNIVDLETDDGSSSQRRTHDWLLSEERLESDMCSVGIANTELLSAFAEAPSKTHSHKEMEKDAGTVFILSSSSPPRDTTHLSPARDQDVNATSNARRPSVQSLGPVSSASSGKPRQPERCRTLHRCGSRGNDFLYLDDDGEQDDVDMSSDFGDVNKLLAAWRQTSEAQEPPSTTNRQKPSTKSDLMVESSGLRERREAGDSSNTGQGKRSRKNGGEAGREELRRTKEAERKKRQEEKEEERQRKRSAAEAAKAKKLEEKASAAAFNEANKSRTDKSVATPEMIVQLPSTLPEAAKEAVETSLKEINAEMQTWTSPVNNVVLWRRKVTTEYKPDLGHWVPVPMRVDDEKHAMVILTGDELVQLILDQDESGRRRLNDLGAHVRSMRRHFPNQTLIYLIQGLDAWRSKNKSARNRQFASAVRSAGSESHDSGRPSDPRTDRTTGRSGGRQAAPPPIDEAIVDDALLELQMTHGMLIHETKHPVDTARWIRTFTEQIATAPYRQQKEQLYAAAASFCMDPGQIATGDGSKDTYSLVLQQIGRVTEPVALGVAARFGSLPKLVQRLQEEGPLALEACLKSRNRNGALSDRTVGPALSKRIYKVFVGQNEKSTDV